MTKQNKQENNEWEDYDVQKLDGSWTTVANLLSQERKLERERVIKIIENDKKSSKHESCVEVDCFVDCYNFAHDRIISKLKEEGRND